MTVLIATRPGRGGATRRRYETEDGRRYTTDELPETVVRALSMTKVMTYLQIWNRGEEVRVRAAKLKHEVSLRADWKATAVAHELGCTEARVRQIRKELQNGVR